MLGPDIVPVPTITIYTVMGYTGTIPPSSGILELKELMGKIHTGFETHPSSLYNNSSDSHILPGQVYRQELGTIVKLLLLLSYYYF